MGKGIYWLRSLVAITGLMMVVLWPGRGWSGVRTLDDMAGRTVTLTGEVNRIVTTFKPSSLCLFSLGLQGKLVGIDTSSKRDRLLKAVMPGLSKVAGVGSKSTGINFETVVALSPDLVILYAQKNGVELADRLAVMGIKSIIILPESFDSVKTSLQIIATAAGVPERAKGVEEIMDGVLQMVEKRVATLSPDHRKTGYFASPRGLFSTATGSMLQDEIFTRAGVINVAHDLNGYFQDISPEQFMTWNPDMVILSQHLHQRVDKRLSDPAMQRVTAVAKKAIYRSPSDLAPWDFPSPLAALGTLWLANKAYPGLFDGIDIDGEIDLFHVRLFGKSLGDMNGNINDQVY
jgi:iron complex transport system substrate-binding protein